MNLNLKHLIASSAVRRNLQHLLNAYVYRTTDQQQRLIELQLVVMCVHVCGLGSSGLRLGLRIDCVGLVTGLTCSKSSMTACLSALWVMIEVLYVLFCVCCVDVE